MLLTLVAVAVSNQSCKAWRTIATSATYVQQNDSAKAQTTRSAERLRESANDHDHLYQNGRGVHRGQEKVVVYLRCFPSLSPPATLGPLRLRRQLVYTLLGGVFSRRGTRKSVEQGASYSERVYTLSAWLQGVRTTNEQKNRL